jgi:small subunit ribosomal protein S3
VKVWLYKGDILPYKASTDKASREAAMAVGETAGGDAGAPMPVVSSAARRRTRADQPEAGQTIEPNPELEALLADEAAMGGETQVEGGGE